MTSVWWSSPLRTPLSIRSWYCRSGVNKAENDKYGQEGLKKTKPSAKVLTTLPEILVQTVVRFV